MSIWDGNSKYYSGQGTVLIGKRTAAGKPAGLIPVGNVSRVIITNSESQIEHKESQTGQRTVDLVLTTQLKPSISLDLESVNGRNLALALWGGRTDRLAGTLTNEAIAWYANAVQPTKFMKISTQVVKRGATTLTAFVAEGTPYDYKVNTDSGSVLFNDGATTLVSAITTGGTAPSAITVGNPTDVTLATPAGFVVGDRVVITGFAGADAALVNGKAFETVVGAGVAGHVYLNVDTTGKTITLGSPLSCFEGQALTIDYSYAGSTLIDALNQAAPERWIRFEGLNTADSNNPLVVDCFRFRVSPLREQSLLSDDVYKYTLEGDLLQDVLQTTGSQYYKEQLMQR